MTTLDRINIMLRKVGGVAIQVGSVRQNRLHVELDKIDRQLGIRTRTELHKPSRLPIGGLTNEYVGARVRRLEHALVQRDIARIFNQTPDYFHLGFQAEVA